MTKKEKKIAIKNVNDTITSRLKGALQAKDYYLSCLDNKSFETAKSHAKHCADAWTEIVELTKLMEKLITQGHE